MDDPRDQFPVGMRVLAVDDDPTCLLFLETVLRKCRYNVTKTESSITALEMLRETNNKFDLVITDVHMPDMDGFKLLEIVGLEMDLPVIMLSTNGDPKTVMKGITHGACDYLLKPVGIKVLQNIWQHVIRRKKFDSKEQDTNNNEDKPFNNGKPHENAKPSNKRKNLDQDDNEVHKNDHDNEDPSTHKKSRVVWTRELHRKFVAVVSQLGVDKAVPKNILDLMNIEGLTRANVASHLQKYKLYLKRISSMTNQQANTVADLGNTDLSHLKMGSLIGVGHSHKLTSSQQFPNNSLRSFPSSGLVSRLNTSSGLNKLGTPFSGAIQLCRALDLKDKNDPFMFQSTMVRPNQNSVQGMSKNVGLEQLQHNKGVSHIQNPTTLIGHRPKVTMSSLYPVLGISNNTSMWEANYQDTQGSRVHESSTSVAFQHSQFSLPKLDHGRYNDMWLSGVQSWTNSYCPNEGFRQVSVVPPASNMTYAPLQMSNLFGASSTTSQFSQSSDSLWDDYNMTYAPLQGRNLTGASSTTSLFSQSPNSLSNMQSQGIIDTSTPEQISSTVSFQRLYDHNQDSTYPSHIIDNPVDFPILAVNPEVHIPINSTFNKNLDFNFGGPLQMKHDGIVELSEETSLKPHQEETSEILEHLQHYLG